MKDFDIDAWYEQHKGMMWRLRDDCVIGAFGVRAALHKANEEDGRASWRLLSFFIDSPGVVAARSEVADRFALSCRFVGAALAVADFPTDNPTLLGMKQEGAMDAGLVT